LAGIGVTRRAIGRGFEMGIAESAIAAARQLSPSPERM